MKTLMQMAAWTLLAAVVALLAMPDMAAAQAVRDGETARRAAPAAAPDGRLGSELQRALETRPETAAALLVPAVQRVRPGTTPRSPRTMDIAAPGRDSGYICNGGNCACAGADDCVKMIAADGMCTDGTVGCNDYGCTCKEN